MRSVWEVQCHLQENGATVGLADTVRPFNTQTLHDGSAVRRLLVRILTGGLETLAVSPSHAGGSG